mmetsp:Transcript_73263/g.212193  ORF Transcript_73263/g.212193 Transcript_73263/m.212193 type:complete len:241 (+) Transcript_73263:100-822(+)|eukprot:CAMPEP_0176032568 /NCGR_PEP_ID=MMETSP0120_2-20121206/16076_1 /TAXON_ID=160619 /ORGANISM="Kryptoperidinium foliaceum, Strain CCMP 1326" /LENGTH=240 /DNA_ID=CAMNT_0017365885 /DNA_START=78 /DNA_END=800 /DNA_ORIENTATION=-
MTTEVDSSFLHLAGSKLKRQLGGQLNENAGSAMPKFAKAQLEKLGWKEGEGLGKRRQGMNSHIKVVKRAEGLGLGQSTVDPAIEQSLQANDWWKNSVGSTLAKLAQKSKKKKKSKKESSSKVYTDEELFKATGGARFGMRAQTQQHAKWKRAESNISEQDEMEAQKKVEWDGKAAPKVLLSESSKKTKSKEDETEEERAERKRQKKEKKKRKREEEEAALVTDDGSSKKKAKKSKKSKKG